MSRINYIQRAVDAARLSLCSVQHGALIYRGGCVLVVACNRKVTHPISAQWSRDPSQLTTIHAEQRALILARADVRGATLVSVRLNGDKRSRPCVMCASLMQDAGIRDVIYFDGEKYVKERLDALA